MLAGTYVSYFVALGSLSHTKQSNKKYDMDMPLYAYI